MPIVTLPEAATILAEGGLVAIPTETVYGLAANALDAAAVAAVFARKGRPAGHPLILHARDPRPYARFDVRAERLSVFWPGPLAMVLPMVRESGVVSEVTGGRDTIAVRCPDHPVTLALLAMLPFPLAAPSANRFGQVSPTTAAHVLAAFPEISVVDGGPCQVGVESTIVDLTGPSPAILRPGGVPADAVVLALGQELGTAGTTAAPGTLPTHYAPRARVLVADDATSAVLALQKAGVRASAILRRPAAVYARALYAELRSADAAGAEVIVCEPAAVGGLGDAVNDRLRRAAASGFPPG